MNTAILIILIVMVLTIGLAVTIMITIMAYKSHQEKRNADAAMTTFGITALITSMVADFVHKDVSMKQGTRLNQTVDKIFGTMEGKAQEHTQSRTVWEDEQRAEIRRLEQKLNALHGKVNKKYN